MLKTKIFFSMIGILGLIGLFLAIWVYEFVNMPLLYISAALAFASLVGNCAVALYELIKRERKAEK